MPRRINLHSNNIRCEHVKRPNSQTLSGFDPKRTLDGLELAFKKELRRKAARFQLSDYMER
jgi:hypothetical protein